MFFSSLTSKNNNDDDGDNNVFHKVIWNILFPTDRTLFPHAPINEYRNQNKWINKNNWSQALSRTKNKENKNKYES